MAVATGCGMRSVMFGSTNPSVFVGSPVNIPATAVYFPSRKLGGVAACVTRKPRGITKPRQISDELKEFVGAPEIARTQVLKVIWKYIKDNNLQDPSNKKVIICDEKLKKIFAGQERVGFLEVTKLITPHFLARNDN